MGVIALALRAIKGGMGKAKTEQAEVRYAPRLLVIFSSGGSVSKGLLICICEGRNLRWLNEIHTREPTRYDKN